MLKEKVTDHHIAIGIPFTCELWENLKLQGYICTSTEIVNCQYIKTKGKNTGDTCNKDVKKIIHYEKYILDGVAMKKAKAVGVYCSTHRASSVRKLRHPSMCIGCKLFSTIELWSSGYCSSCEELRLTGTITYKNAMTMRAYDLEKKPTIPAILGIASKD
jgi:hypothetical protein